MPKAIDMEMLTSPHQATEAATMVTEVQALLEVASEAATEEKMKDMALLSTTSMMAMAVNKSTAAMEVAQVVAQDAAQAKTIALAEPKSAASVTSSEAMATAASSQMMAGTASNQTTTTAVSSKVTAIAVDLQEMAAVVVIVAKVSTIQMMALPMKAMVTQPKIAAMVKPRTAAGDSPRTMATDSLKTMATGRSRMMATNSPRTMATDRSKMMAMVSLKQAPSTESETTLIKSKVNLRTMATAKSMKTNLNKHKIMDIDSSKITIAINECSKHGKFSRTAEQKETMVDPRWMDTNVHTKL